MDGVIRSFVVCDRIRERGGDGADSVFGEVCRWCLWIPVCEFWFLIFCWIWCRSNRLRRSLMRFGFFFFFFCQRHVVLPPEVAKLLPKNRLLSEVISLSDLSVCCVNYNWLQNNFHIKKCMSLYLFIIWIFEGTSVACLNLMIWVKKSHDLRFLLFDKHVYVCIYFLRELLGKMWFCVARWWNWFTVISFS